MEAGGDSEPDRDFQVFTRSGTPGEFWGGGRVVFHTGRDGTPMVKRSEGMRGRHPETAMLAELRQTLPRYSGSTLEVTVFQNASPCASCSEMYAELVNKAEELGVKISLQIVFVALFKVRRPSRILRPSYNVLNLSQEDHRKNVRGLQRLSNLGVELRTFGFQDWQRLRELLALQPAWQEDQDYTGSVLQRDNQTTAGDLQLLLDSDVDSDEDEEDDESSDIVLAESDGEEPGERQPPTANAEPAETNNRAKFLMFWDSGLHGVHWKRGARALYVIEEHVTSGVFANSDTFAPCHAEVYLLRDLRSRLLTVPSMDIKVTVYQNLSPCGSCCVAYDDLLEFFRNNDSSSNSSSNNNNADSYSTKNIKLTIVFARFYNIQRPSCSECNLHPTPPDREHYQSMAGLLRLRDRGVALRCFQEQDWLALHGHLQVPGGLGNYASSRRRLEDDLMAEDTSKVFGCDLVARPDDGEAGGRADSCVSRQELRTLQETLLGALRERFRSTENNLDSMRGQTTEMTLELKRFTSLTLTLARPLLACLVILLCYFLFGWRPLAVILVLVTQLGMTWAGQHLLREGGRSFLLLHLVQSCLSLCLAWVLYTQADWRAT